MEILPLLESLAFLLVVLGVWLIGNKNVKGQYLMVVAQVFWFTIGFVQNMPGLQLQSVILFGLALRASWLWRKNVVKIQN